jgi:hypothetical protein
MMEEIVGYGMMSMAWLATLLEMPCGFCGQDLVFFVDL